MKTILENKIEVNQSIDNFYKIKAQSEQLVIKLESDLNKLISFELNKKSKVLIT